MHRSTMKLFHSILTAAVLFFSACGGVPPDLLGEWSGPTTVSAGGNDTPFTGNLLISESPTGMRIVATGIFQGPGTQSVSIACTITARPTASGFVVDEGSKCSLTPGAQCSGVEQPVVATLTEVTAVKVDKTLSVSSKGSALVSCNPSAPSAFTLRGTLTKK